MVESIKACVPRGDFVGSAAADTKEGLAPLRAFAERHGVDVATWEPFGISLCSGEHGYRKLTLLAVDRKSAGRSEDDLRRYLGRVEGHPTAMKFVLEAPVDEFLALFTKLNLVLLDRRFAAVEEVEIAESAALRY